MKSSPLALLAFSLLAAPAFAQTADSKPEAPKAEWSGEGAFNAGFTTGNTETRDAGVSLKALHKGEQWTQAGEFAADYGDTDKVANKNRIAASGQVDRVFGPKWNGYTRLTWERDEFSGFDNRYFAGLGLAWKAVENPATTWTLEGGPGYKVDEIRAVAGTATTPAALAYTEKSFGARGASHFRQAFNERVSLTNDSEVVYSDTSTQLSNGIALNAEIMGNLSARVSVDVRHDTSPPAGFKDTDTSTKFSLVYKVP